MSLEVELSRFAQAVGLDVSTLLTKVGNLNALTTAQKSSLVGALNEVRQLALDAANTGGGGSEIDDAGTGAAVTWSAQKIAAEITEAIDALVAGAPSALDTLHELATALQDQDSAVSALTNSLSNRVRFDAPQTLTEAQQVQACQNIGVGDPTVDLVAAYNAAKA